MISVVIPAYKKTNELVANLRHNFPYLKNTEVIVVNDDPSVSIQVPLSEFKDIILIENKKNLGFSGAANTGLQKASGEYVLLLNSDVKLIGAEWQQTTVQFVENQNLFALGFSQMEKDRKLVGKNIIYWKRGLFMHRKAPSVNTPGKTGWAEGGASLFDTQKLKTLGYFDTMFSPFYWEDIDLSYRAWKAGYEVEYTSLVMVQHEHESTIGTFFKQEHIKQIAYRNQLLFIWKNISDPLLKLEHFLLLPFNLLYMVLKGETAFVVAFFMALPYSINIIMRSNSVLDKKTDKEILNIFP